MRNVVTCWAPECAEQIEQPATGRGRRYHSNACKQRAFRRNGGKGPSEPYPPLGPEPLHQDAPAVTVAAQSEQKPRSASMPLNPASAETEASSDAAGKARKERRDSVQPPAVATAGTAPAPTAPPQGATDSPEAVAPPPDTAGTDPTPAAADEPAGTPAVPAAPGGTVTQLHVAITEDATVPVQIKVNPMVARYRSDLERMGILDTRQGLHILEMAEKLVSSSTSASAATNVSRELERLMAAAEQDSPEARVGRDPSVAIRERTIAKLQALSDTNATGTAESA
jgi:hypothetical protein